jgi:hypothetical protein
MKVTAARGGERSAKWAGYNVHPVVLLLTVVKWLRLPKPVKYAGYLLVKNRPIWAVSRIRGSNIPIQLNLGDFIQYWIYVDGIYEVDVFRFLRDKLQG